MEELHIKLNFNSIDPKLYISFVLHNNGSFEIKLLDIQKSYIKSKDLQQIYHKINDLITIINKIGINTHKTY